MPISALRVEAEVVVGLDELMTHSSGLQELLAESAAPATARWRPLVAWLRHNPSSTPWCVLVHRDRRLVAAALLARERRHAVAYRFRTIGERYLPGSISAIDSSSAKQLAGSLAQELAAVRLPWSMHLYPLDVDDPVAKEILRTLRPARAEQNLCAPRLEFRPDKPLNAYLSRNTRSAAAKARNRIRNAGLVFGLSWTRDRDEIVHTIPEIAALYHSRNKQLDQNAGSLGDPAKRLLFEDMMRAHAAEGQARLLTLRLNGDLASYAMCLEAGRTLFVYSNRMSPDWDSYSPGLIANAEVVRAAHHDPALAILDWGIGIQRYKLSGASVIHRYQSVHAWSGRPMCWASGVAHEVARAMARSPAKAG